MTLPASTRKQKSVQKGIILSIIFLIIFIFSAITAYNTYSQLEQNSSTPITKDPNTGKGFFAPTVPLNPIVPPLNIILFPFLQEAEASNDFSKIKDIAKKMERQVEKNEELGECAEENLEKTLFYSKKGKIYHGNPDCDPTKQYRYDRLNQMSEIDEYKDKHNFVLSNENYFQVENEDDEKDDRENKEDREDDDVY